MKYTIHGFQQRAAHELNLNDRDLLYLRWFIDFKDTDRMVCLIINNEPYHWVKYQAIIDDHPCLEIKNRETIARRFMKLCEAGVLKKHIKKDKQGTFTLFSIGENYLKLVAFDNIVESKLADDKKVDPPLDKKVDPKYPNTNINNSTSPIVEVKKPKTRTPEAQKDYDNRDLFIEHLKTKHNYEIIPDNSFNKMFFPKLKQYGIDKLLLVIDNYFADVKENGKFAGTMDSVFYQPLRFAKYANMNKQETTNDDERVQAILATRKKFEGLNDTRKR